MKLNESFKVVNYLKKMDSKGKTPKYNLNRRLHQDSPSGDSDGKLKRKR